MSSYPLPVYHFKADWGGTRINFSEITGLDKFIEPIQYREGASPVFSALLMPGLEKFNTITLKRVIIKGDLDFSNWMNTKRGSTIERRDITISLLDEDHEPVMSWRVLNAFPIRYSGPKFIASSSEAAFEELELVHEGMSVRSDA